MLFLWQVAACFKCNSRKGKKTLEEAHMQLLRVPKVLVRYLYHAVENHASENMWVWLPEELWFMPLNPAGTKRLRYTCHTPYRCSNKNAEGKKGNTSRMASISTTALFGVMTSINWTIVHSHALYILYLLTRPGAQVIRKCLKNMDNPWFMSRKFSFLLPQKQNKFIYCKFLTGNRTIYSYLLIYSSLCDFMMLLILFIDLASNWGYCWPMHFLLNPTPMHLQA